MKTRSLLAIFFVLAMAAATSACGGGGGGTAMPPPPSPTPHPLICRHTFSAAAKPLTFAHARFGLHPLAYQPETTVSGKLAVRFLENRVSPQAASVLRRLGAVQDGEMNPHGAVTFSLPASIDVQAAAAALNGVSGVASAGPIIMRHLLDVFPNDTNFNQVQQWDMYAIRMPSAWAITEGLSSVKIAVIDTGYDATNPDLIGKVDAAIVFDLGTGAQDVGASIEDKDGHGSDVSGIAAADTNNMTLIAGTGFNVHLMEARVFPYGSNSASTRDIASAVDWAVNNGASVINLSLGSGSPDNRYEEPAIAGAIRSGVIVAAASGNGILVGGHFVGQPTLDFPAADPGVLAVGASADCDSAKNIAGSGFEYVASYSNFGTGLSLVAPGGDPDANQTSSTCTGSCIDFLQWIENLDSNQGQFHEVLGLFAGTSMASPHVAGAAALMVSKSKSEGKTLTPAQALSILKASADNLGDSRQGSGRLNTLNALNQTP